MIEVEHPTTNYIQSIPESITNAISEVMNGIKAIPKDGSNDYQKFKYMSIDSVLNMVNPLMAKAKLVITCFEDQVNFTNNQKGVDITIKYKLLLSKGKDTWNYPITRQCTVPFAGGVSYGIAQSYMLKQFYRGLFSIATGEFDKEIETYDNESDKSGYAKRYQNPQPTKIVNVNTERGN